MKKLETKNDMLVYIEPKFPKSFAISMEKIGEYICYETGVKDIKDIPTNVGWDYIENDWKEWLVCVHPWFEIVDKEENKEMYNHLLNEFKKYVNKVVKYGY